MTTGIGNIGVNSAIGGENDQSMDFMSKILESGSEPAAEEGEGYGSPSEGYAGGDDEGSVEPLELNDALGGSEETEEEPAGKGGKGKSGKAGKGKSGKSGKAGKGKSGKSGKGDKG